MRTKLLSGLLAIGFASAGQAAKPEPPKPADTHTVKIGEHTFTLPKGFTIEKVAGSPLVERPVNGSFDGEGRLYVSDSSGSNDKPTEQVKNPTHRVIRLESTQKDGVFDKAVVFADKLSFLQGTLWHAGSLYVAAPPVILKLTDTDGDGIADKREVWFDGKTLTGCANDLHGPYLGPEGKIYWTKGGFAAQEHTLKDGTKFKSRAAHIFRADADGKNLEVVMTGGMDNPVGVAFTWGRIPNLFFTSTFLQHPENGRRDGIVHATYGAVYGKDHDVLDGHIRTGPKLSEPMTHLGPAAPSGLVAYRRSGFGKEYFENLFCAQFNMAKVSRHVLKPKGSTYETIDSDFVTSDNRDFHPTDVIVAPDDSLLIVDTGGWYKLCCPSSQLVKKEALGAIYRVRPEQDRGSKVAVSYPVGLEHLNVLSKVDPRECYRAAEKYGLQKRPNGPSAVPDLLAALSESTVDAPLDAALTRAIIDIGDIDTLRLGLTYASPRSVRAALAALEQIPDAKLTFAEVRKHLDAKDADLRETAWWIAGRHPEWGKDLAAGFAKAMAATEFIADRLALAERIAKFAGGGDVQTMLADNVHRLAAVEAMGRARLKVVPPRWMEALAETMAKPDAVDARWRAEWNFAALSALRAFPAAAKHPAGLDLTLLGIARDAKQPERERLLALAVARPAELDADLRNFAFAQLEAEKPATLRTDAIEVLLHAKWPTSAALELVARLPKVSLLDLDKLLPVFAKNPDELVGSALLTELDKPALRAAVRAEQLKPIFAAFPKSVRADADKFMAKLDAELAAKRAGLDKLLESTQPGDIKRGQLVFNSTKTNCAACHMIGYVGGSLGPDLTRIGSIRTEKDLLESIVLPSASFVRSYEPVQVVRLDGRSHNGILKKDSPDEVVLAVSATEEVRIPRRDIDTFKPGTVSVMPAGLEQQVSKQELADLLAFLRGLR